MSDDDVLVGPAAHHSWKQTLLQPKVWIPAAAVIAVVGVVVAVAATAGGAQPAASPSPSASSSAVTTAVPSSDASPSPSVTPSPSASDEPSAEPTDQTDAQGGNSWPDDYEGYPVLDVDNGDLSLVGPSANGEFVAVESWILEAGPQYTFINIRSGTVAADRPTNGIAGAVDWLPTDATAIVASTNFAGRMTVELIDMYSGEHTVIADASDRWPTSVDVAPDGKHAVVVARDTEMPQGSPDAPHFTMLQVALDGSGIKPLGSGMSAVYSPKGDSIFFKGAGPDGIGLWQMRADGSKAHAVSNDVASLGVFTHDRTPVHWGPDGSIGVYIQDDGSGKPLLRGILPDGTGDKQLAQIGEMATQVQFNADGSQVLVVGPWIDGSFLTFVDLNDSFQQDLVPEDFGVSGRFTGAGWMPDGSVVVGVDEPGKAGATVLSNNAQVKEFGEGHISGAPIWTSDGKQSLWPVDGSGGTEAVWWFSNAY